MVNEFHLEAKTEIESDYTCGNVPAGVVASHRAKSTNQRPIAKPSYTLVIELSVLQRDSRPRANVQVPSPFHPAIANAQPCNNCKESDSMCRYDISPDRAKTSTGRPNASYVPCRERGRKCVKGITMTFPRILLMIGNKVIPKVLDGYNWLKAGTVHVTEQNLCGEFRHMKTPQRTPHVVVIQDVVKMT